MSKKTYSEIGDVRDADELKDIADNCVKAQAVDARVRCEMDHPLMGGEFYSEDVHFEIYGMELPTKALAEKLVAAMNEVFESDEFKAALLESFQHDVGEAIRQEGRERKEAQDSLNNECETAFRVAGAVGPAKGSVVILPRRRWEDYVYHNDWGQQRESQREYNHWFAYKFDGENWVEAQNERNKADLTADVRTWGPRVVVTTTTTGKASVLGRKKKTRAELEARIAELEAKVNA